MVKALGFYFLHEECLMFFTVYPTLSFSWKKTFWCLLQSDYHYIVLYGKNAAVQDCRRRSQRRVMEPFSLILSAQSLLDDNDFSQWSSRRRSGYEKATKGKIIPFGRQWLQYQIGDIANSSIRIMMSPEAILFSPFSNLSDAFKSDSNFSLHEPSRIFELRTMN